MLRSLKISVVTPNYNSGTTLRETIESVLSQHYPDLEHIVMDGGSTDGSLSILKEYPHLLWVSEKDAGHFDAMNKGVARASGELIVILNSDDCFRPGALAGVANAFREHPEWDASFGDAVYVDGEGQEIYRREEAVYDYNVLRYWNDYICHQTLFVRKSVYERIGGYSLQDLKYCCDFEFILRLGREGCTVGHVRAYLVNFRFHAGGMSGDSELDRKMRLEALRIREKYGFPGGAWGSILANSYRAKRQLQKLRFRGTCDLISGRSLLRKHQGKKPGVASGKKIDDP